MNGDRVYRKNGGVGWLPCVAPLIVAVFAASPCKAYDVLLRWTVPRDPTVAGYRVYSGLASRTYGQPTDVGLLADATDAGVVYDLQQSLQLGVIYYFAVTAYNSAGLESDFSNERVLSFSTVTPPTVDAGLNQTGNVGDLITLGSLPLAGISYFWQQVSGPPAILTSRTTSVTQVTSTAAGTFVFALTAYNADGIAARSLVTVTLTGPSPTPSVTPAPAQMPTTTVTATFQAAPSGTPTSSPTPGSGRVRLYLTSLAPSYAPAQAQGAWSLPPSAQVLWSLNTGGLQGNALRQEAASTTVDVGLLWGISEPIVSATFPPGSVLEWGIEAGEQSTDARLYWHVHLYILTGSTNTVRCTLLTDYREDASSNNAWPVTLVGVGPRPNRPGLASCGVNPPQAGDRLAIEIGYVARNTLGSTRYGFVNYGTTAADVTVGKSGGAPWVDLVGATISFQGQPTPTTTTTRPPSATATRSVSATVTATATRSATATPAMTRTPTRTASPTITALPRPTGTPTVTPTNTIVPGPTGTPTFTATPGGAKLRLYLTSLAPSYAPAQAQGAWSLPPSAQVLWSQTKGGALGNALRQEAASTTADIGLLWGISEPIVSANLPPGSSLAWGIEAGEQSTDAHLYWHVHLYVLAGSTSTLRCVLLADYREDASSSNEWPVTPAGLGPRPSPPALASCGANPPQVGDRLAIEIGYVARNTLASSRYGFVNYGTTDPDVVVGQSGGAAWVDLIGVTVTF